MKKYISIILFSLISSLYAQNNIILSPQDSAQILEKAGLKVMFLEASLNYIADPYTRSKDVIKKNSYAQDFDDRIFLNENVLIEDDLHPVKIRSISRPEFMSAKAYLQGFHEMYRTTDPKSVTFRVSKIRYLGRTSKGLFAEIFFESTFGGQHSVDALPKDLSPRHLRRRKSR